MAKVNLRLRGLRLSFPHNVENTSFFTVNQRLNIFILFLHNVENVIDMWKTLVISAKYAQKPISPRAILIRNGSPVK